MNDIKLLVHEIFESLNPNAPISAIEQRVWMLKCRNTPDDVVIQVIQEEYGEPESTTSDEGESMGILVHSLPEEFVRDDWS